MSALRPGYRLRPARGDDFEAVRALLEDHGRTVAPDEELDDVRAVFRAQVIDPASHLMVVVDADGAVVAFCALHFRRRLNHATEEAWVAELCVRERARLEGIATAMLEEAERRAVERGCHQLATESPHQHAETHEMLRRYRMRDAGRQFRKQLGP